MEIHGYKAFAPDMTNRFGKKFPVGKYHVDGDISFGVHGNGIHFAKNIEDTIRYGKIDDGVGDVTIAEVIGSGIIVEGEDSYGGFYDLYCASDLEILRYLTRVEIINIALNLSPHRMERFVSYFRLTPQEMELFYGIDLHVDAAIDYYQKGIKDVYYTENINKRFMRNVKVYQIGGMK